jgi:hypothetical protein
MGAYVVATFGYYINEMLRPSSPTQSQIPPARHSPGYVNYVNRRTSQQIMGHVRSFGRFASGNFGEGKRRRTKSGW